MWHTFNKKEYWILNIRNVLPIFEDGKGNTIDGDGHEPLQMKLDKEAYPLDNITDFDTHPQLKLYVKVVKGKVVKNKASSSIDLCEVNFKKHYENDAKKLFFFQVYKKGLTAGKAVKIVNIPRKIAYNWYKKDQLEIYKKKQN